MVIHCKTRWIMSKYSNNNNIRKRLARIERKCERILTLLSKHAEDDELDRAIGMMHRQARRMRAQAMKEARDYREKLSSRGARRWK